MERKTALELQKMKYQVGINEESKALAFPSWRMVNLPKVIES